MWAKYQLPKSKNSHHMFLKPNSKVFKKSISESNELIVLFLNVILNYVLVNIKGDVEVSSLPSQIFIFLTKQNSNLDYQLHLQGNGELVISSTAQSCLILCDPMDYSTPGFSVYHQLPEFAQTQVHLVGDAIHSSHPLLSPSPPAFNLSQHQGLFQWVSSLHQVAKVLEFQLQHQSFPWIFRSDFL